MKVEQMADYARLKRLKVTSCAEWCRYKKQTVRAKTMIRMWGGLQRSLQEMSVLNSVFNV